MSTLNKLLIAEAMECEFKSELEVKRPKSWLKTVSAFANGLGGSIFFGVDDDKNVVGMADIKTCMVIPRKSPRKILCKMQEPRNCLNFVTNQEQGMKCSNLSELRTGSIFAKRF